jgi:hypothetical protein
MNRKLILLFLSMTLGACASIVSGYEHNISVNSTPSDANFKIIDKSGAEIYSGKTPASISLNSGDGYFSKAQYSIKFEKYGRTQKNYELTSTISSWYWVNILFLNIPGLLIVDPATGAMYKLPGNVDVSLNTNSH